MTISPHDVRALSATPGPGGMPLPVTELERIAAVLNQNSTPRPGSDPPGTPSTDSDAPDAR